MNICACQILHQFLFTDLFAFLTSLCSYPIPKRPRNTSPTQKLSRPLLQSLLLLTLLLQLPPLPLKKRKKKRKNQMKTWVSVFSIKRSEFKRMSRTEGAILRPSLLTVSLPLLLFLIFLQCLFLFDFPSSFRIVSSCSLTMLSFQKKAIRLAFLPLSPHYSYARLLFTFSP